MQSAGLGGRKQLQGDAETTIFSQQGYKIVKASDGIYEVTGPSIPSSKPFEFRSPDAARAFIIERMKRDGTYGKFGKDAKAKDGGPGSGIKGHTTSRSWQPSMKQKKEYAVAEVARLRGLQKQGREIDFKRLDQLETWLEKNKG